MYHMSPIFWISFPFRSPRSTEQSSLCYVVGSSQLSLLYIVMYNVSPSLPVHPTPPFFEFMRTNLHESPYCSSNPSTLFLRPFVYSPSFLNQWSSNIAHLVLRILKYIPHVFFKFMSNNFTIISIVLKDVTPGILDATF